MSDTPAEPKTAEQLARECVSALDEREHMIQCGWFANVTREQIIEPFLLRPADPLPDQAKVMKQMAESLKPLVEMNRVLKLYEGEPCKLVHSDDYEVGIVSHEKNQATIVVAHLRAAQEALDAYSKIK